MSPARRARRSSCAPRRRSGRSIRFDAVEGFKVSARHWVFEDLDIQGVCADHSDCEHAFHVFGDADFLRIRRSRVRDFNAQIKSNRDPLALVFPDDVVIEGNEFADTVPRQTGNPVTKIDVVGGRRWIVRANFIHDFEKVESDHVSYAAFLKGNSRDGLFERNLVICERDHSGGVRLGLSLGGGGSSPGSICEDGTCTPEHQHGTLRNNVVVNCPQDVGIYLNAAADTRIYDNTLIATTGIDVRFAASTADIRNNLVSGQIRNRDGGSSTQSANLTGITTPQYEQWFADPLAADLTLLDGSAFVDLAEPLRDRAGRLLRKTPRSHARPRRRRIRRNDLRHDSGRRRSGPVPRRFRDRRHRPMVRGRPIAHARRGRLTAAPRPPSFTESFFFLC